MAAIIITLVIVVIVMRAQIDVVQHYTKDLRTNIRQQLPSTPYHLTRTFSRVYDEDHAVYHRCDKYAVSERCYRRRVDDNVREVRLQKLEQICHLFRADKLRRVRRDRARR